MDRELLKKIITEQREYPSPEDFIERTASQDARRHASDPHIVIITGVRRSGKSTIMEHMQHEMSESDYFINFDDDRLILFALEDFQALYEVFIELFGKQRTFYFDEIQNILHWETFVRRLHNEGNKIFITGSNANLLSRELGTRLTGRFVTVEVFPLSFREIVAHEHPKILQKKVFTTTDVGTLLSVFSRYLKNGGFPAVFKVMDVNYLKSMYEGIIYRDIIVRNGITNEKPLRELCYYFASNIGKEFSFQNLSKILGLGSGNTVSHYCRLLEVCYLFFFVNRYNHSLQKQMLYNKKCYMIDPALIQLVGFRVSDDRGRLLENCVLLHLKMRNEEVFFHKDKCECDFVLRRGNKIYKAIQVTTTLKNNATREREIAGLLEAMEDYDLTEGLILTENEEELFEIHHHNKSYNVNVLPIWKWLLGDLGA